MRAIDMKVDLGRPALTEDQIKALKVGDKIMDIQGGVLHVAGFISGIAGERITVIAYWHKQHEFWKHSAVTDIELRILYTPYEKAAS